MPGGEELAKLEEWMRGAVPGFAGPMEMEAFAGGQSNPTYRVRAGSGEYVLRRRPMGAVLPSAHQVDREFRVLRALAGTGVPVPEVYAYCGDEGVIGSAFYVMAYVPGRVFMDPRMPGVSPAERGAVFRSMAEVVAALHGVDPVAVGLEGFGRPSGYMRRQFARWSQQYRLSETGRIEAMERLMAWLPGRLPEDGASRVVHGDLRLDNMLLHPTEPRVVAVLDWELSTLGDPMADLANSVLAWHMEPELFRGLRGCDLGALGVPTEAEYLAAYRARAGVGALPGFGVYVVFGLFRLAAIIQGIAKRALEGTASSADAAALGGQAGPIAERGWELAQGM